MEFAFKNARGVVCATGSLSADLSKPNPEMVLMISDSSGNLLRQEVCEDDLGDRFRNGYHTMVAGGVHQGTVDVIKDGDPLDPFQDPSNAAQIEALGVSLSAYPKLQRAVAALVNDHPDIINQKGYPLLKRNLKALGCVVIATVGLVSTAAGWATVVGCGVGLGVGLAGLAYFSAG
jgi:hypothetical protein